ncbi:MAG: methylmalonyl Co-A mutase-associated GTPase MeaB [Dehalococcoidia bacterium]
MPSIESLVEAMVRGDKMSLARLISRVERESPDASEVLRLASPHAGKGYRIGFTGPPGSGKSTLVDRLTAALRARDSAPAVGIIAVDPSSPFSGGALLGDRIRMEQHYNDEGVFIRSMGTRGGHGGLPNVAQRAATLLEASGKDYVLIETVGVGQTELDVMEAADTVVVVMVPEAGDSIQTMKAGLMEIADVFVVNKSDRDGADKLAQEIDASLKLSPKPSGWSVPVLNTQAHRGVGIQELMDAIEEHRRASEQSGELQRRRERRRSSQFFKTIEERMAAALHGLLSRNGDLQSLVQRIETGELDPYAAALDVLGDRKLLRQWLSALEG